MKFNHKDPSVRIKHSSHEAIFSLASDVKSTSTNIEVFMAKEYLIFWDTNTVSG
jgi:hypothetical protein